MAIIDKRKEKFESLKEDFSVRKAIDVLEEIGYKVYKDVPVSEAKKLLKENGFYVFTESEFEEMDEKVNATTDALIDETVEELLADKYVLTDEQLEHIEEEFKNKLIEEFTKDKYVLTAEQLEEIEKEYGAKFEEKIYDQIEANEDVILEKLKENLRDEIIEELAENEDVIIEKILQKLKEEQGYTILSEEEVESVDEELKKIIESEVNQKLNETVEFKKEEKPNSKITETFAKETKKTSMLESLVASPRDSFKEDDNGIVISSEEDEEETPLPNKNDATNVAAKVDNGIGVMDTNLDPDEEVEDKEIFGESKESKRGMLVEKLV